MLGILAGSRKTSGPTLCDARTLLGAGTWAGQASLRGPSKSRCASSSKPSNLPKFLPRSSRSLEEEFEAGPGVASSDMEYTKVLNGDQSGEEELQRLGVHAQVQRILRTRHEDTRVSIAAHETRVWEELMTLPGNLGAGNDTQRNISFTTAVISELCEGSSCWWQEPSTREESEERQHAMLCQIFTILEFGAKDSGHDLV